MARTDRLIFWTGHLARLALVLGLGVLAGLRTASAQSPAGSLRGAVEDQTGGRIAGALVVVQTTAPALKRETRSDDKGEFRMNELPPGVYQVTVQAQGFSVATASVTVSVSLVQDVIVTLRPAAVQQN